MKLTTHLFSHLLIALIIFFNFNASGQSSLIISLEPNLLLANRSMASLTSNNYLSARNSLGIGVNFGYHKDLGKNFYGEGLVNLVHLRNAIVIDYPKSGFNDYSEIKYDKQSYGFSYLTGIGLSLSGGYKIKIGKNSALGIGIGAHATFFAVASGFGVSVNDKTSGTSNLPSAYRERIDEKAFPYTVIGGDAYLNYYFKLKQRAFSVGMHYCYNPGDKISGTYETFQGFTFRNSGMFEMSKSYVGFVLGMAIGKK